MKNVLIISSTPRVNGNSEILANEFAKGARFLLTFFLGFIGSFIINHTSLKPRGWKSRTCAYFFLSMISCGIYGLVASICNLTFKSYQGSNIGYFKDYQ